MKQTTISEVIIKNNKIKTTKYVLKKDYLYLKNFGIPQEFYIEEENKDNSLAININTNSHIKIKNLSFNIKDDFDSLISIPIEMIIRKK